LYPPGHDFFVAKLDIDGIWLIDFYGGAANIAPEDYYAANLTSFKRPMQPRPLSSPPPAKDSVATARWMVGTLMYGALSTISTRSEASTVGDPFGNPQSFADVNGVPHIWASMLDSSMMDLFSADGSNPRASLALSEASLAGGNESVGACTIGHPLGDLKTLLAHDWFSAAALSSSTSTRAKVQRPRQRSSSVTPLLPAIRRRTTSSR